MPSEGDLYSTFYDSDPAPIVEFLAWLAGSYGLDGRLEILDMGCGPGRLLVPLAGLRWKVVGMEPDDTFRSSASQAVSQLNEEVAEVVPGGWSDLNADAQFDLVVAVNDPFSYLLTPTERIDAFGRCANALKPGGVIFIDIPNFHWILKNYRTPPEIVVDVGGSTVTRRARHEIEFHDAIWTHTDDFEIKTGADTRNESKTHRFAMITLPEVVAGLTKTGFEELRTYNGYAARRSERLTGPRIMVSARHSR